MTEGLSTNSGVFGADGTQARDNHLGVAQTVSPEAGVFTDSYSSQFIELGIGQLIN